MTQLHPVQPVTPEARHVPLRTCVGCKTSVPQGGLVRVVLVGGRVVADPDRRAPGRGAWVHPTRECLAGAAKGGFARSFRTNVGRPDIEAIAGLSTPASTPSGQGGGNAVESVPVPSATD